MPPGQNAPDRMPTPRVRHANRLLVYSIIKYISAIDIVLLFGASRGSYYAYFYANAAESNLLKLFSVF